MLILGYEVKFQQDLEIAWVLFTLFFYVLSWCLNIVRSSMEKYKLKRLLFFSHFINSYSCLHLNIKKWEGHWRLLIWQLSQWPLRNHLFPSSLPHIFFSWLPWGTHRVLLMPPWTYCFLIFLLGSSRSWQESQTLRTGGRRQQSFSGMWDRWKDRHPWNTRRLEASMSAGAYVSVWSGWLCVYL